MAKLLLHTSTLAIRINGDFQFPSDKNCKTVTIKKLLKLIQKEPVRIEYLGYDYDKSDLKRSTSNSSILVSINVIEDPMPIDYQDHEEFVINHFLRQVKKNTSRILIQEDIYNQDKVEKHFELYVRGVASATTKTSRTLRQA